jgi:hypothetical protein
MKKTRVNIISIYNSIYDIIKLRREYITESNENISQTYIVFDIMSICKWKSLFF